MTVSHVTPRFAAMFSKLAIGCYDELKPVIDNYMSSSKDDAHCVSAAEEITDICEKHGEMTIQAWHPKQVGILPSNLGNQV